MSVWPGTPAPNGNAVAPSRSTPRSAPQDPRYRLKNEQMRTRSSGRSPAAQRMRPCTSPIRSQSSDPMPNTVGRPVVPLVPWMRATPPGSMQRYSPYGGAAACDARSLPFPPVERAPLPRPPRLAAQLLEDQDITRAGVAALELGGPVVSSGI